MEIEGMIKGREDYDPVIFMLEDTRFHADYDIYYSAVRDRTLDMEAAPYCTARRCFSDVYGLEVGQEETRRYMAALLRTDPPGNALVLGFTEMGPWGATDNRTEQVFKAGTLAVLEAIEEHGRYPIRP